MAYFIYKSKKIFYREVGEGVPVVFLHGNTASSKMFEPLLPFYQEHAHVVLIDFLGNGKSERIKKFPHDLYQEEAKQTIALIEHLNLKETSLVGTSGGAWAAVNAGLMRPDLVKGVVADSFSGRAFGDGFAETLEIERKAAKQDEWGRGFYQWCQGEDWEQVVDSDTEALLQCARENLPLFVKPISELKPRLLLLGSLEDTMVGIDIRKEYEEIARQTGGQIHLFRKGDHPAIASNAKEAAEVILDFLGREE